jgi:hypothetical protein
MTNDAERISGYADALQAIEDEIRDLVAAAGGQAKLGLEVALATVQHARVNVHRYHDYLLDLREAQEAGWGDWAETDCVPCLAETAPHTCLQPW